MQLAPKDIYRYRSFTRDDLQDQSKIERLLSELNAAVRGETWFSTIGQQKDPFDTNPIYFDSKIKEVKEFYQAFWKIAGKNASFAKDDFVAFAKTHGMKASDAKRHLKNYALHIKTARQTFFEYREKSLISCFSECPASILMWSYYSASHSSFCFRFSRDMNENGAVKIADVRYVAKRPQISTIDMFKKMAASRYPNSYLFSATDVERLDNATLLCKSDHWAHEKEWRSLLTPNFGAGYHPIEPYYLSGIVFGALVSGELVDFVKAKTNNDISYQQCVLSQNSYQIEFVDI